MADCLINWPICSDDFIRSYEIVRNKKSWWSSYMYCQGRPSRQCQRALALLDFWSRSLKKSRKDSKSKSHSLEVHQLFLPSLGANVYCGCEVCLQNFICHPTILSYRNCEFCFGFHQVFLFSVISFYFDYFCSLFALFIISAKSFI